MYEIPLDPAILNQEPAGPGGEWRAIRLDIPVAALNGAAAREELAFGQTVSMPMPGGSRGADSSYCTGRGMPLGVLVVAREL